VHQFPLDIFCTNQSTQVSKSLPCPPKNVESTSKAPEKRKKKCKSKQKPVQVPTISVEAVKQEQDVDEQIVDVKAVIVETPPVKVAAPDIVTDDIGFIEVTNKKCKVRANKQLQQHEIKSSVNRGPVRGSNNAARGLPRRPTITRPVTSVDRSRVSTALNSSTGSSAVPVAPARVEMMKKVLPTEPDLGPPKIKYRVPVWPCHPSSSRSSAKSSSSEEYASNTLPKVNSGKEGAKTVPVAPSITKTGDPMVPKLHKVASNSSIQVVQTDSGRLSQQHRLLTDFMISSWANFAKSLH